MVMTETVEKEVKLLPGQAALLTDFKSAVLAAIAGCLSGDTLIDTPTGEWCIAEMFGWHEVLSLTRRGVQPSLAYIFRKGKAQLYQVQTETGKIIEATENHYLLTSDGQTLRRHSVGELMPMLSGQMEVSVASVPSHVLSAWREGYLLDLQPTNSELYQSILDEGGCYSQRLPQDYQSHCSVDCRLCDEQSHVVKDSDQVPSPLSSGVLVHIPENLHGDGLKPLQVCIHAYQSYGRPARSSLVPSPDLYPSEEYYASTYTCEQSQGHDLEPLLNRKLTSDAHLLVSSTCKFQLDSNSCELPFPHPLSLLYYEKIVSVKPTRIADYYDMFVPKYHNYLAHGMVHHNTGGGKTMTGYWFLHSRMEAYPGNTWGMAEPTYNMLSKIILESSDPDRPTLEGYFKQVGHHPDYHAVDKILYTDFGKVYLGSADRPDSMQGAAVKGYWLDEAGQMGLLAHETASQRCSMLSGQELLTTTPYNLGWLLTEIVRRSGTLGIHVETWRSIDRPGYPRAEYERQKKLLPWWRFAMVYDARFEKPAGLIYSSFDEAVCVIDRFPIPQQWLVYSGHDFGPDNPGALFYAQDTDTGLFYLFDEYLPGSGISVHERVEAFKEKVKGYNVIKRAGGSPQEEEARQAYNAHGWVIAKPKIAHVEPRIEKVFAMHQLNKIMVFSDMVHYLDEKRTFARELDGENQPTAKIANEAKFHLMSCEQYILSDFTPETVISGETQEPQSYLSSTSRSKVRW